MLPWVYDPDAEGGVGNQDNQTSNGGSGDGQYKCQEAFYADYYQQYQQRQTHSSYYQRSIGHDRSSGDLDRRARSRSRSRSRGRNYDRDRDRSRSRDRRRRSRDRSHSRSPYRRRRSRSRSRGRDREYSAAVPINKLAVLNLPHNVDRNMIALALAGAGYLPQDIRVIHRNDRGAPRSFGFIDFADVTTAIKWMDETKGWLTFSDGRRVQVEYAKSDPASGGRRTEHDWTCANCSVQNYFKREVCFKCDTDKASSDELERQGLHMVGVVPCDTLLIRSLPPGCTTATVFDGLSRYTNLNSIIQLQMSDSKQYAYIQMRGNDEATLLLNSSYKAPIQIAGKDVIMTFCRHSMNKLVTQQIAMLQSGYSQPPLSAGQVSGAEVAQAAMIKAAALRQVQAQVVANASGVVQTNTSSLPPSLLSIPTSFPPPAVSYNVPPPNMVPTNLPPPALNQTVGVPVVVGTAVPNMSLPPPSASQQNATPTSSSATSTPVNGIIGMTPTPRGVFVKYVTPNPLTFVLEPSTGYFVDPLTKFYYDAKTTYYFNNDTRQWCYWDQTYSTYFPVEENTPASTSASTTLQPVVDPSMPQVIHMSSAEEKKRDEEKPQKSASDIAKEMMKWAKKQEKAKVHMSLKPLVKPLETKSALETVASGSGSNADADLTYKMLEKSKNPLANMSDDSDEEQPLPDAVRQQARMENNSDDKSSASFFKGDTEMLATTPQRHVPSAQEQREMMERALIDESKKMCLLCKRAFPSVDVLRKHVDKSDLHKKNLEDKRVEWGKQYVASLMAGKVGSGAGYTQPEAQPKVVYRDRAKERRQTYGLDAGGYAHSGSSEFGRSEETIRRESELAARRPIEENNIGSKLLKSMGWREGQGVGKNAQGIVNPIEAERRVEGAGLGASGSRILHGAEASHKERVRATFYNRYREME